MDAQALESIARHNAMIDRANAEIDRLRAAGHQANGRLGAQGVTIEIVRAGYRPQVSYLIITE